MSDAGSLVDLNQQFQMKNIEGRLILTVEPVANLIEINKSNYSN